MTADQQAHVALLDDAIAKGTFAGVVYRGVNFGRESMPSPSYLAGRPQSFVEDSVRDAVADYAERRFPVGKVFELGGYQSTSVGTQPALDAALSRTNPGIVCEINAKRGLEVGDMAAGRVDDEGEVLLSRATKYRVLGVKRRKSFETSGGSTSHRTVVIVEQVQ